MNINSIELLNLENSAEKRIQAAFQLLSENTEDAVNDLIKGLFTDPSPIVRHECAYCIGEMNFEKGANALIEAIQTDVNKFVIHEAALAVSNMGIADSKYYLEQMIGNSNQDLVDTAEISLQRLEMKLSNQTLEGLNYIPEEAILNLNIPKELRIQSAFKLLEQNTPKDIDILIKALQIETSPIVKHEIIFSLGETMSQESIHALSDVLRKDDNVFVLHETLLALSTLGNTSVKPLIIPFTKHEDEDVAESATIALERLLTQ